MSEIWKFIPGHENRYQVSSLGRVRSVNRTIVDSIGRVRRLRGVDRSPRINPENGYVYVSIDKIPRAVHVLVLSTFDREPNKKEVCRHKDGNKTNNNRMNLTWGSYLENYQDAVEHLGGEFAPSGERSGACKYTDEFVASSVEYTRSSKMSIRKAAKQLNIPSRTLAAWISGTSRKTAA